MKGQTIKAVLFDLDGTLLNTLDDIADSANHALRTLGLPTHPTEDYKYFVGDGMTMLLKRILPDDRRSPELLDEITSIYASYYSEHAIDRTKPYAGVPEMLQALKKHDSALKLAVISNKPDEQVKITIDHFFEHGTFDYSSGGLDGVPLKPHPAMALRALEALCVGAQESVFVGDTGMDMQTAKSAGCLAIGAKWGFRSEAELKTNGADYLISSPEELVRLICS